MARKPKRGELNAAGGRQISGTKILVIRNRDQHFDANRRTPINEVPLEKRTGSLAIHLCLEGLKLNTSLRGNEFPNGVGFEYAKGCEVFLEVFPRGRSKAEYQQWQQQTMLLTRPVTGVRAPLVMSPEARIYPSGYVMLGHGDGYTKLMDVLELNAYLKVHLPLLGLEKNEVAVVAPRVNSLMRVGQDEIPKFLERLAQKRAEYRRR